MVQNNKAQKVHYIFNSIAPVYDLLNNIISLGLHKSWKTKAVNLLDIQENDKILDLCCGSGDITELIAKKFPNNQVIAVDFSEKMLQIAEKRLNKYSNTTILQADAYNLPFQSDTFDKIIISFGLRNLKDISMFASIAYDLLSRNGIIVNIDFGKPENLILKLLFNIYMGIVVPLIGLIFNKTREYSYLPDSIKAYPDSYTIIRLFKENGFTNGQTYQYFGGFVSAQKIVKAD